MGVNQFTDMTHDEFSKVLGVDKDILWNEKYDEKVEKKYVETEKIDLNALPKHVDWRKNGIISNIKDQGQCGSCWTFGTTENIESYYALKHNGMVQVLSEQEILDCTPNPLHCGGTGGCGGGTARLAMNKLIQLGGQTSEWMYPYISWEGKDFPCHFNASRQLISARLQGFVHLPGNKLEPVMDHLAKRGPLITNVDASAWQYYETGVFNSCNNSYPDIDHVVQMVGYGFDTDLNQSYFLIRNSWTVFWGEAGYIRLHRSTSGDEPCGMDIHPQDGNVCNGGPVEVKACGSCGVLYSNDFPILQ